MLVIPAFGLSSLMVARRRPSKERLEQELQRAVLRAAREGRASDLPALLAKPVRQYKPVRKHKRLDGERLTPLMEAAQKENNGAVLTVLLNSGASVDAKLGDGRSAIHFAVGTQNISTLVAHGANLSAALKEYAMWYFRFRATREELMQCRVRQLYDKLRRACRLTIIAKCWQEYLLQLHEDVSYRPDGRGYLLTKLDFEAALAQMKTIEV